MGKVVLDTSRKVYFGPASYCYCHLFHLLIKNTFSCTKFENVVEL